MQSLNLPYFDELIERFDRQPDSELAAAFKKHVHWGYFDTPQTADDSCEGYIVAAEELARRVCDAGRVGNGLRILDVGCGFGGAIDHLNARLSNCELTGLNIDARQLARARELVRARPGNKVEFVEGDACKLPFADNQFDVVLAIECIFHFDSRERFFEEAHRVLKPGGTLALSDFVVNGWKLPLLPFWMMLNRAPKSRFYGGSNITPLMSAGYTRLARMTDFECLRDDNITAHTMPTYPSMRRLYREAGLDDGEKATDYLEATARSGFIEYHILSFGRGQR